MIPFAPSLLWGVVFAHAGYGAIPSAHGMQAALLRFMTGVIDCGKVGVIAFFMVSGFVIPISLKFDKPKKIALQDFLLGRVFRLYPAYWLSMILAFIFFFGDSFARCSLKRVLLNVTMFQQFFGGTWINMIGLYWTLQIEWIFYLLCIGLFVSGWLASPKRILQVYLVSLALALLLAGVRHHTHRALPLAAPLGLCVMLAGSLWRMVVHEGRTEAVRSMRVAFGSFLVAIPFICRLAYSFNAGYDESWTRYTFTYWIGVGGFLLLTSKCKLTWRPLATIGRASYSLYLFNDFFHEALVRVLPMKKIMPGAPVLYVLLGLAISCLLALPLYKYIESPAITLGKKIAQALFRPPLSTADQIATQYV